MKCSREGPRLTWKCCYTGALRWRRCNWESTTAHFWVWAWHGQVWSVVEVSQCVEEATLMLRISPGIESIYLCNILPSGRGRNDLQKTVHSFQGRFFRHKLTTPAWLWALPVTRGKHCEWGHLVVRGGIDLDYRHLWMSVGQINADSLPSDRKGLCQCLQLHKHIIYPLVGGGGGFPSNYTAVTL